MGRRNARIPSVGAFAPWAMALSSGFAIGSPRDVNAILQGAATVDAEGWITAEIDVSTDYTNPQNGVSWNVAASAGFVDMLGAQATSLKGSGFYRIGIEVDDLPAGDHITPWVGALVNTTWPAAGGMFGVGLESATGATEWKTNLVGSTSVSGGSPATGPSAATRFGTTQFPTASTNIDTHSRAQTVNGWTAAGTYVNGFGNFGSMNDQVAGWAFGVTSVGATAATTVSVRFRPWLWYVNPDDIMG